MDKGGFTIIYFLVKCQKKGKQNVNIFFVLIFIQILLKMDQRKIRDIMKEQLELVKTEKELKEMIDKINLSLNQLLVSESYFYICFSFIHSDSSIVKT